MHIHGNESIIGTLDLLFLFLASSSSVFLFYIILFDVHLVHELLLQFLLLFIRLFLLLLFELPFDFIYFDINFFIIPQCIGHVYKFNQLKPLIMILGQHFTYHFFCLLGHWNVVRKLHVISLYCLHQIFFISG